MIRRTTTGLGLTADDPRRLGVEFRGYLARQLRRRGLAHPALLAEGLDLVPQIIALELLSGAEPPDGWPAIRALLDRAVYKATRELRQRASSLTDDTVGFSLGNPWERRDDEPEERAARVRDLIERLPVAKRLLAKLKLADVFLPGLATGDPIDWRADEVEFLRHRHGGLSQTTLDTELRARVGQDPNRQDGKVPAEVIAWLLGRAGPGAVDSAYHDIKQQLRRSINAIDAAGVFQIVPFPGRSFRPALAA